MAPSSEIQQRVNLAELGSFADTLRRALVAAGVPATEQAAVWRACVGANCAGCGVRPGREVLVACLTSSEPADPLSAAGWRHLRQGYCVTDGCKARFYEFTFAPHPALDWAKIEWPAPGLSGGPVSEVTLAAVAGAAARSALRRARWRLTRALTQWVFNPRRLGKVLALLGLLGALVLYRQWFTGGHIPFLREEKSFTGGAEMLGEPPADDSPE